MAFDHELKVGRAVKHLQKLHRLSEAWLDGSHHTSRQEYDPKTRTVTLFATADQPPKDRFGTVIGDCVHNLRSALDNLAYALAAKHTAPLPDDIAESSEFPILGDEDRDGTQGVGHGHFHNRIKKTGDPARGSGLFKIRGSHPTAQTLIEGLQPYHRGNSFRDDPLWVIHELDRIDKHRLVHTVINHAEGLGLHLSGATYAAQHINVKMIGPPPTTWEVMGGPVEQDTPVSRIPVVPIDPTRDVYVHVDPVLQIAFAPGTPCVEYESVTKVLGGLAAYVTDSVIAPLAAYV